MRATDTAALPKELLETAVAGRAQLTPGLSRQAALARFLKRGFPSIRAEDWKYTDLTAAIDVTRDWLARGATSDIPDSLLGDAAALTGNIDASWIVIGNGQIVGDLPFSPDNKGANDKRGDAGGIVVERLSQAAVEPTIDHPLADFNAALLTDGLHIRIPQDATPSRPLGLLFLDQTADQSSVSLPRVVVDVAAGAQLAMIEYHVSKGSGGHYSNAHVELNVADGSQVDYVRLQHRDRAHSQTERLNVTLARDARFHHFALDLGGALTRNDLAIDIRGPGAEARFDGLYIAGDGQHIDNHTRIDHRVGPARSAQEYRGILRGQCQAVWNGKAIVHEGADGTDAVQGNHNLLLSEGAEIDAKPELEIYADDVKCAHGTTVGQLDEDAVFYLRSRGIELPGAERILTHAFAARIVEELPIDRLTEMVNTLIDRRLGDSLAVESA